MRIRNNRRNNNSKKRTNKANKTVVHKLEVTPTPVEQPTQQPASPLVDFPPQEAPAEFANLVGNLSVGVFTALGALPVPGAVVTVYYLDENNEEVVLVQEISDENGKVPDIQLWAVFSLQDALDTTRYFFSTYNLRVEAENYYPVNVIGVRIFPETTTRYNIDLFPRLQGDSNENLEQTIVIPPSPIDFSNV